MSWHEKTITTGRFSSQQQQIQCHVLWMTLHVSVILAAIPCCAVSLNQHRTSVDETEEKRDKASYEDLLPPRYTPRRSGVMEEEESLTAIFTVDGKAQESQREDTIVSRQHEVTPQNPLVFQVGGIKPVPTTIDFVVRYCQIGRDVHRAIHSVVLIIINLECISRRYRLFWMQKNHPLVAQQ
jgi:hypothetical protein